MSDGIQLDWWREYYEKAWNLRKTYMDELIERGESCPYRIIQLFQNHERRHITSIVDGEVAWVRKEIGPDDGDLLPTGFPVTQTSILRGKYFPTPYYTKQEYYRLIVDLLEEGDFDSVVELGCGYGKNLIEVYYNGGPKNIDYIGGELSESGRRMMRNLSSLIPIRDMEVHKFDLVKPDFSFLGSRRKVLFFTVYAIQQVREISMDLIERMAGAADYVKTVYFEPFGFQLEPNLGEATANHVRFTTEKGWNINLGPILVAAHNFGLIRCTHLASEILGGGTDPLSLAVWEAGAPNAGG